MESGHVTALLVTTYRYMFYPVDSIAAILSPIVLSCVQNGDIGLFAAEECSQLGLAKGAMQRSRNRQLQELFPAGFGMTLNKVPGTSTGSSCETKSYI